MKSAPPGAAHFDKPGEAAAHIAPYAAVIVTGPDAGHAATLAVAVARSAAASRRVALGDLVGELGAVYALAGGEDALGLAECFRDGLTLNDIARPVTDTPSLFVLPAGAGVRAEPALASVERWTRLIRGFGEAGGLLVLVVTERSPLAGVLTDAGAVVLYAGAEASAPAGLRPVATIGATLLAPPSRRPQGSIAGWQMAAAALAACVVSGWSAVELTRLANAPDGTVVLAPALRLATDEDTVVAADTVTITERASDADREHLAPFAVEVVAANTASNANSLLHDAMNEYTMEAPTISVVAIRSGGGRSARWHKVMFGAWRGSAQADSAIDGLRRRGVVSDDGGVVVRAPYAILLADSASGERARAVAEVWKSKGVASYVLVQRDGSMRVYAGAFETVAQAVTMAAMVHAAGGAAIVAFRTGRAF